MRQEILFIVAGGIVATLFAAGVFITQKGVLSKSLGKATIDATIMEGLELCSKEGNLSCYRALTDRLRELFSLQEFFRVIAEKEREPLVFQRCHTLLHFLGRSEYERFPNVASLLGTGSPMCFAGYYHGVLEGYLSEKNILPGLDNYGALAKEIPALCQKQPFRVISDYYECLHGLGHALMFAMEGELPSSLHLCDILSDPVDRDWCYSGAFMENSTSSTNKDHPSSYLRKEDPSYPCSVLEEKYALMCYALQTFYAAELFGYEWEKLFDWCTSLSSSYQGVCFHAVGQIQVGYTQEVKVMKENCGRINKEKDRRFCLDGIVGALAERYPMALGRIAQFCTIVDSSDREFCYRRMIHTAKARTPDAATFLQLCISIPDQHFRTECEQQVQ